MPKDGILVRIMGDYGPFSRMGKSIGYLVEIGNSCYLVDCGAPVFQQIGGHGLKNIKGLIATHSHDDHKRWFTDLALFKFYAPDFTDKVRLFTSEDIHQEFVRASGPALNTSLSPDSKRIIDIPYHDYIDTVTLGPAAKYKIVAKEEEPGRRSLIIAGPENKPVGPERAKIVINPETATQRMLFRDPGTGEWVEPESFYTFSSDIFYSSDKNIFTDEEGFTITALKSPVWHGVPTIGIIFSTSSENLVFSSDTVHDIELWEALYKEKNSNNTHMSKKEFEKASIIFGDINNYIERTWSEERFHEAVKAFENAIVIHDVSAVRSIVHTDYSRLNYTTLKKEKTILTHSPDRITSEWVLGRSDKVIKIAGDKFYEVVDEALCEVDGDIYHKNEGEHFVGYKNPDGRYYVYEINGLLTIVQNENHSLGNLLYRVDLYQDIAGRYFPKIEEKDTIYYQRSDGRVELLRFTDSGSVGEIVESIRENIPE